MLDFQSKHKFCIFLASRPFTYTFFDGEKDYTLTKVIKTNYIKDKKTILLTFISI